MESIVKEYIAIKWILSVLFAGNDYIINAAKRNEMFREYFFSIDSLKKIKGILTSKPATLDDEKIKNLRNAMEYYLVKEKDIDLERLYLILDIIKTSKHMTFNNTNKFYQAQYDVRNNTLSRKVTEKMRRDVDRGILGETRYLIEIHNCLDGVEATIKANDIEFLKSINVFLAECPEMLMISSIEEYIKKTIIKNQEFEDNEELQRLNDVLLTFFTKKEIDYQNLNIELNIQEILSLIFNSDFDLILDNQKKLQNKEEFFNEQVLNVVALLIQKNKELCMFDKAKIENIRSLLLAFDEEKKISREELNEMKIALNVTIDEEYKRKNKEFYLKIFSIYNNYNHKHVVVNFNKFKKTVDALISSTPEIIDILLDPSIPVQEIASDIWASHYMNYIINRYEIIIKNPLMVERIQDILFYNEAYLTGKKYEEFFIINNIKTQKKIKKLQK